MQSIIVTDLTHFKNQEILCIAGIDPSNGQTIRPMPYLNAKRCRELNLLPGALLEGWFRPIPQCIAPHSEDCHHEHLTYHGRCSGEEFRQLLAGSAKDSVSAAFGVPLQPGEKCFPIDNPPKVSLATVSIDPRNVEIVKDQFEKTKIKLNFLDGTGSRFRFVSITDLGFFEYALTHHTEVITYAGINTLLSAQREVFLRIGLGRAFQDQRGRNGYWMQINGIYSFPEYFREARRYV